MTMNTFITICVYNKLINTFSTSLHTSHSVHFRHHFISISSQVLIKRTTITSQTHG